MKTGADISHQQAQLRRRRYYASGEDFIFHKATERADFMSTPTFKGRWQACAGKPRGAYHFARRTGGDADADAEADHFIRVVKAAGWRAADTWALDLESNDAGLSAGALLAWADRWCARVRAALPQPGPVLQLHPVRDQRRWGTRAASPAAASAGSPATPPPLAPYGPAIRAAEGLARPAARVAVQQRHRRVRQDGGLGRQV